MASEHVAAAGPVRVVLADDAAEMRALVRWALERGEGVEVVGEAADAAAALRLAADLAPDAILLDLQMPGMGPDALLAAVADAAPEVAIVTFSGYEPQHVAPRAAGLVRLHVPKTTDLALLREELVAMVRRSS